MAEIPKLKPKEKVGNILPGQHWVELHGTFHPSELLMLAKRLNENIAKIKRNGNKK